MAAFKFTNDEHGLSEFNHFLADHSYVAGFVLSGNDFETFSKFTAAPDSHKLPHVSRWYNHIKSYSAEERSAFPVSKTEEKKEAPAAPAAAAGGEDDFELFGETTAEEKAAEEARKKEAEEKKKAAKPAVQARSMVVIDVKPWDDTTDMKALEEHVRGIKMEGLTWGQSKLVPVVGGIKKLQISSVVVDDLVSLEEVEELICANEDLIQSMDIASFNKL